MALSGKPPAKLMIAGLAQQFEEFADGRGFNVVEAVGKGRIEGHGGVLQRGKKRWA
jgi:hypothetical protein